jgi:uncharacterized cupin superfamily protein
MKVNRNDLEWTPISQESDLERKKLGAAAGSEQIGCSLYRLPDGGKSWPYHYHTGNEEALFVLDGTGMLRTASRCRSLRAITWRFRPTNAAHTES